MKVGQDQKIAASPCLSCGKMLDGCTAVDADGGPCPGDFTVCISCGHLMAFADDLTLRELTSEEMHAIAGDKRIIAVQQARKALKERAPA
jgi:hypothetical protein